MEGSCRGEGGIARRRATGRSVGGGSLAVFGAREDNQLQTRRRVLRPSQQGVVARDEELERRVHDAAPEVAADGVAAAAAEGHVDVDLRPGVAQGQIAEEREYPDRFANAEGRVRLGLA